MVHAQSRTYPGELDAQNSLEFWDKNRFPNPGKKTKPKDNYKRKRICRIVDFAVPVNHRVKIKENETRDK